MIVDAGSKGLIDKTYFQATAEFRQRAGPLLEKTLQMAVALRSYRLTKTIIEAVTMFKIGTLTPIEAADNFVVSRSHESSVWVFTKD